MEKKEKEEEDDVEEEEERGKKKETWGGRRIGRGEGRREQKRNMGMIKFLAFPAGYYCKIMKIAVVNVTKDTSLGDKSHEWSYEKHYGRTDEPMDQGTHPHI